MGFITSIKSKIQSKKTTKTLKFQTSLQCGGCVQKVKPHLDTIEGVHSWDVKLNHADKLLKVEADEDRIDEIADAVKSALEKEEYTAKLLK